MMELYNYIASRADLSMMKDLIDKADGYANAWYTANGYGINYHEQILAAYAHYRTAFVPTNDAVFAFAETAGYTGTDPGAAVDAILAALIGEDAPGAEPMTLIRALTQITGNGFMPLSVLEQQNFATFDIQGTTIIDADAQTQNANIIEADIKPIFHSTIHIIDSFVLGVEVSFNDSAPVLQTGTAGDDDLIGGEGDDSIALGAGEDAYNAGKGNDTVLGEVGDDMLKGGLGDDTVNGGADNDVLDGNKGNDTVIGGAGEDLLKGGEGDDDLQGGAGNDILHGNKGNDRLDGGADNDRVVDAQGDSTLIGGTGNDFLKGGAGADVFVFETGSGNDRIRDFGNGADVIDLTDFGLTGIGDLALVQQGGDTLIALGTGETILLDDTLAGSLTGADFLF